jgi:hypothetical protein
MEMGISMSIAGSIIGERNIVTMAGAFLKLLYSESVE